MTEKLKAVEVVWQVSPSEPALSVSGDDVRMRCNFADGTLRPVTIRFLHVERIELHDAISDHEVVREADYDWTAIPDLEPPEFFRRWHDEGVCPDPGFYTAVNSAGMNQYIVVGREHYVLVSASGWHEV